MSISRTNDTIKALKDSGESVQLSSTDEGSLKVETVPSQTHQVDFNVTNELLREIISQMKVLNLHMASITSLEDLEEDSEDNLF